MKDRRTFLIWFVVGVAYVLLLYLVEVFLMGCQWNFEGGELCGLVTNLGTLHLDFVLGPLDRIAGLNYLLRPLDYLDNSLWLWLLCRIVGNGLFLGTFFLLVKKATRLIKMVVSRPRS